MRLPEGDRCQFLPRTVLLTALAALGLPERVIGVEADQVLSFNPGKFLIQPQFDAAAQYTGNLFYAPENPSPGGFVTVERDVGGIPTDVTVYQPPQSDVVSDVVWILSPGLELQYGRNPENSITASVFFDQLLYTEYSDFNSQQERVNLGGRLEFGRFTFKGDSSLQWLDTILGGSTAVVQRTPIRRFVWLDNYRLTYDATMKTDVYLGVDHNVTQYLQPVNLYDTGTARGILGATYKVTERIGVFTEFEGGHTSVEKNLQSQANPTPSNVYGGFVGARGNFTSRLDGSVKVGYETRQFPDVIQSTASSSPAVGVALNYTQTVRRYFSLTYDRRVGVSSQVADQSYIFDSIFFSVTQGIGTSGRWIAQLRGGLTLGNYSDYYTLTTNFSPPPARFLINNARNEQTYNVTLALMYQPNAWLTTTAAYNFEKYSATFPDPVTSLIIGLNDYNVNRFTLQVSIGY